jgi:hypothetical protein
VRYANAFAFDSIDTHRGGVKQNVDEVIVEQVDFVDIQQTAIGVGKQPGLEAAMTFGQGMLEVE